MANKKGTYTPVKQILTSLAMLVRKKFFY